MGSTGQIFVQFLGFIQQRLQLIQKGIDIRVIEYIAPLLP